jgi:hypothetical protein
MVYDDSSEASIIEDAQQPPQEDELIRLRKAGELRERLKKFVSHANPVPDEDFDEHPFYRAWDQYMVSAARSHDQAKLALQRQEDWSAYWNAVHAMASYHAAHTLVQYRDEPTAYAHATFIYFKTLTDINEDYPELYNAFAKQPSE